MELTQKWLLDRQLCTGASLHIFLYYIPNGQLRIAQVTDKKQMLEAEWYEKGNTDNEGIVLPWAWSQGANLWLKEHLHIGTLFWAELWRRYHPNSACDSALQQQNSLNHWLLIHMSWLGCSKKTALHSATTRLQVIPVLWQYLLPAQSLLAILPIFLIQCETKIATLLMTWNKILQRRAYLDLHTLFSCTGRKDISVPQGPGYSRQFSWKVVQAPQKLRNIINLNHSVPNPVHKPMNSPLWCKLLIVSMNRVHLSWKILSKYFTEITSLWK